MLRKSVKWIGVVEKEGLRALEKYQFHMIGAGQFFQVRRPVTFSSRSSGPPLHKGFLRSLLPVCYDFCFVTLLAAYSYWFRGVWTSCGIDDQPCH